MLFHNNPLHTPPPVSPPRAAINPSAPFSSLMFPSLSVHNVWGVVLFCSFRLTIDHDDVVSVCLLAVVLLAIGQPTATAETNHYEELLRSSHQLSLLRVHCSPVSVHASTTCLLFPPPFFALSVFLVSQMEAVCGVGPRVASVSLDCIYLRKMNDLPCGATPFAFSLTPISTCP